MYTRPILIVVLLSVFVMGLSAQALNDYRSVDAASGSWNQVSSWQRYDGSNWGAASTTPTSSNAGVITVRSGANIEITANVSLDQLVIQSGANVEITGGTTTIADGPGTDLVVYGYLKVTYVGITPSSGATISIGDGGVYEHNRSLNHPIVTATWQDGSTCLLTGTDSANPAIGSLNFSCMQQDFYDLILDYGVITEGNDYRTFGPNQPLDVRNTLKLLSGHLYVGTDSNPRSLDINNLEIQSGKFVATRGYAYPSISIRNDLVINGGTVIISEVVDAVDRDYSMYVKNLHLQSGTLNLNAGSSASHSTGRLYVSGDFNMSGGILTNSPAHASTSAGLYFNGNQAQSFIWTGGSISSSSGGAGRLFYYKSSMGPTSLNEVYGGSSAQVTINGSGGASLPSGFSAWPSSGTLLSELNIDNPAGVSLSTSKTVNTALYLNSGTLSSSPHTLGLANGSLIVRKSGNLASAPAFGATVTLSYLFSSSPTITGYEVPASSSVLHNFNVNNVSGVRLGSDIHVNGTLTIINGLLDLNSHSIYYPGHSLVIDGGNSLSSIDVNLSHEAASQGTGNSSISRKWSIIGNATGDLNFTFSWPSSADNGGDFGSTASVWRHNGNTWIPIATDLEVNTQEGIRSVVLNTQISSKADSEGDYTITGEGQTLPVTLSSFTAVPAQEGLPLLCWTTQSESNLQGYYLYRNNSINLVSALRISACIPGTNSPTQQSYSYLDTELIDQGLYYYWLQALDLSGISSFYGPLAFHFSGTVDFAPPLPQVNGIHSVYPNPFNPETTIRIGLTQCSDISLRIYNGRGQLVRNLASGSFPEGYHSITWNGRDERGDDCSSGIYHLVMQCGRDSFRHKLAIIK